MSDRREECTIVGGLLLLVILALAWLLGSRRANDGGEDEDWR